MAARPILYYITDRKQFPGDDSAQRRALLNKISEAASAGLDFIQLREKDLTARELEHLARASLEAIGTHSQTRLLINSRTDVALAVGAHGVHLPANDISASQARAIWLRGHTRNPKLEIRSWISVSCHREEDVRKATADDADFAVFAPVFEKPGGPDIRPAGVEQLRKICTQQIPVIALGGVTLENAHLCLEAGAAGIAGIRLFQQNNIPEVVRKLRAL